MVIISKMIIGIGNDIIAISRIKGLLVRNKQPFLQKIFTLNEIALLDMITNSVRLAGYIANRFAAKESFAKALGTGIGQYVSFKDIEILKTPQGKPYFNFSDSLKLFLQQNYGDNVRVHLSMSDETEYAQAFVVMED
jgi:holo-[acyl-carrier protein] synthase